MYATDLRTGATHLGTADVAELVDALVLGTSIFDVKVRVLSSAQITTHIESCTSTKLKVFSTWECSSVG